MVDIYRAAKRRGKMAECKTMLSDDLKCFSFFPKVSEILRVVFNSIETHHRVFFWLVCSSFSRKNV